MSTLARSVTAPSQPLRFPRGADVTLTCNASGLTDLSVQLTLRSQLRENIVVLSKVVYGTSSGAVFALASSDTALLKPGRYFYDVWLSNDGSRQPVIEGTLELESAPTAFTELPSHTTPPNVYPTLGAKWIWSPDKVTLGPGSTVVSAADAGGGTMSLASTSGAEFHIGHAGPFSAAAESLLTDNLDGALTSPAGVSGAHAFHIVLIGQFGSGRSQTAVFDALFGLGSPGAAQNLQVGVHPLGGSQIQLFDDTGAVSTQITAHSNDTILGTQTHILEITYDGTTLRSYVNGQQASTQTVTLNISDVLVGFRTWLNAGVGYKMADARIDGALFADAVLGSPARNTYLRAEMTRLGGTGRVVAFFGDSTTEGGGGGTTAPNYICPAVRNLSSGANVIFPANNGHSGYTGAQILTAIQAHTDPCTHAVLWWGTNDRFAADTDPRTNYANFKNAVTALHARGIKVVVCTLQEFTGLAGDVHVYGAWLALNTLIRENSAGADAVADVAAAMAPYNSANFGDGLHPTDTANTTIIAPVIYAALLTL